MTAAPGPARLTTFTNDGLTFDVIDEGPLDGPVLIALHGFPERAGSWRGVIPTLTAAGLRVLAPDQRGYSPGARPQGIRHYALDKLTGDIIALADQAGAANFHILGHDWGAGVAWQLAADHPDRVRTASILSVPHPRAMAQALRRGQLLRSWYMGLFQIPRLPEWLFTAGDHWLPRKIAPKVQMSDAQLADSLTLLREPGAPTATVNWYRALRHSLSRPAGRVSVPTLYVWSTGDIALGRAGAEATGQFVDAPYRFEVLEGVSHWIAAERPVDTAEMVIAHIRENTG